MSASTLQSMLQEAVVNHRAGRLADANRLYRRVLAAEPSNADALHLLGVVAYQSGHTQIAIELITRAIGINPAPATFHVNLAQSLIAAKEIDRAVESLRLAAARNPTAQDSRLMSSLCEQLGRGADAIAFARRAVTLSPENFQYQMELGRLLGAQGRLQDAYSTLAVAVALRPDAVDALAAAGDVSLQLGRVEESLDHFRRACELAPESAELRLRIGSVYLRLGRIGDAEKIFRDEIRRSPMLPAGHSSLAEALRRRGLFEQALDASNEAIALKADDAEAQVIKAQAELAMGQFAAGWKDLEWRTRLPQFNFPQRHANRFSWDGGPLADRTLLIWSDSEWGDVILLSRYAAVASRSGRVVMEAPRELHSLLRTVPGISDVFASEARMPPADVRAPLLSLPMLCRTTLETLPAKVPYMTADPQRVEEWRPKVYPEAGGPRIGIVWSSEDIDNSPASGGPPMRLDNLAPILATPGARLVDLQLGPAATEAQHPQLGERMLDVVIRDMDDMAAILSLLDLVIAADSAVLNLAGAMGIAAWGILPLVPHWRWMRHRDDSPWYPTMRLFRQPTPGDWATPIARIAEELKTRPHVQ